MYSSRRLSRHAWLLARHENCPCGEPRSQPRGTPVTATETARAANAQVALALIATASPEVAGSLFVAALDRVTETGRDAWLAVSAAFDGEFETLDEALSWLGTIANGEEI